MIGRGANQHCGPCGRRFISPFVLVARITWSEPVSSNDYLSCPPGRGGSDYLSCPPRWGGSGHLSCPPPAEGAVTVSLAPPAEGAGTTVSCSPRRGERAGLTELWGRHWRGGSPVSDSQSLSSDAWTSSGTIVPLPGDARAVSVVGGRSISD